MLDPDLLNVFTWRGRIGRARYLGSGLILLALKHNIDRLIAALYGYPWGIFNYWIFQKPEGFKNLYRQQQSVSITELTPDDARFYLVLVLLALPFIWAGVTLTLRRLRDAELPFWLVALFFIPFVNVMFFIILAAIPSRQSRESESKIAAHVGRFIPESKFGSAVFGILITTFLAVVETVFSANGLANYGWGLFVGIPFFLGLNSSLICGFHRPQSLGRCLGVATISTLLVGLVLFSIAVEGIICLVMALPLGLVIALIGGFIGFVIQDYGHYPANTLRVVSVSVLLLPGLILLEHAIGPTPPVYEVKTSIVIKSDPETVWKQLVVTSSQLSPPTEAMFKMGLAYPIHAEMWGEGVGAERHSMFSTGALVQSITVWDEPRVLAFDVTEQPPAMKELSIYSNVHPPHLENYFIAQRGQFELKPLPDGTTLLEGTEWYQNRYWPAPYWHLWSDYIVNGIHNRILLHIKSQAESQTQKGTN